MRPSLAPGVRTALAATAAASLAIVGLTAAPAAAHPTPQFTVVVAPNGNDHGNGTAAHPLKTLSAAQQRERALTSRGDVTVYLAGGTYRLTSPLVFTAADSGRNGHTVTWRALPGAHPVISGAQQVTGWRLYDKSTGVYEASVPKGLDSRQLFVNGTLATRAQIPVGHSDLTATSTGFTINNSALGYLAGLPDQSRIEVESVGSFTDRYAPVQVISGNTITMQQPAWNNNIWGYDTLPQAYSLYLENSLSFLQQPGQWYLDPAAGALYYKPAAGQKIQSADVELPRLSSLVQIGGDYANPVHDLAFRGLQFSYTSWLGPSSAQGYADQQNGAFIFGQYAWPADELTSCQSGCTQFESARPFWHQMPAAVQVAAAQRVAFDENTFSHLGQVGLGIGNDANANASTVGLGASDITVDHNVFTDDSGGGVVAGGIQADAHHPSDARMTDQNITINDNLVTNVAKDYKEMSGILSTYVTHTVISHNEVADVDYDGIDLGWGWGSNDAGGSNDYANRGLYNYQPRYTTPTTLKDNVVTNNLIHDTKLVMHDGGSIYNLSANPGTVVADNYMYNNQHTTALYLDEGSRSLTLENNVVQDAGNWALTNANNSNNTNDSVFRDNWYNAGNTYIATGAPHNNVSDGNVAVQGYAWPLAAQQVIYNAGIEPALRTGADSNPAPAGIQLQSSATGVSAGASVTVTATIPNFSSTVLTDLDVTLTAPPAWHVSPVGRHSNAALPGGKTETVSWTVTAPASFSTPISAAPLSLTATYRAGHTGYTGTGSITLSAVNPLTSLQGYGSVPSQFGQAGGAYAILTSGVDMWGAGGERSDDYGAIYSPKAASDTAIVTAHVDQVANTNSWAKAGIMLRDDVTAAGSSAGYAVMVVTPGNGVSLQWDSDGDGYLDQLNSVGGITAPGWVRLVRSGDRISGFYSTDGSTWVQVGQAVTLPGALETEDAGMVATSHAGGTPGEFDLSDFTVTNS